MWILMNFLENGSRDFLGPDFSLPVSAAVPDLFLVF